ncbi:MAG: FIST C-terminal domain-containing protein [Treponema sp.]|jgi:hypothetical protein|nr:FIST C-terminal domain-containing protein [Treponema sp.]
MVNMLSAISAQIDDPEAAAAEILEQLDIGRNLRTNSIGLVACNYEFIDAGALEVLEKALPFDIVGVTTLGNAARGHCGSDYLSISVLTSDDVRFSCAVTGEITEENLVEEISGGFKRAGESLGASPGFILTYLPIIGSLGAAAFFNEIKRLSGDTPVFGAFACDQTLKFHESRVIFNGKGYRKSLALVFMEGNIHPRFFVTSIPERDMQQQHALITESEGVILKKVNHMPLLDYLDTLGLTRDGGIDVLATIPFIINYRDGSKPVAMGIYNITPEGHGRCVGEVPVNSTLSIGLLDYENIMDTAEATVSQFLGYRDINGILMYPCLTRNMMLGLNGADEMKKIISLLGDAAPYQICYAGGEICPTENADGKLVNRVHNFTFVACIL